jgi:PAS domain S-box-containing protein
MRDPSGHDATDSEPSILKRLFEQAPMAFQVYGADGRCVFANRAATQLFGAVPPADYNLLQDDALAQVGLLIPVRRALSGETVTFFGHWPTSWRGSRERNTPDGVKRLTVAATAFPLPAENGSVPLLALCFRETTTGIVRTIEPDERSTTAEQLAVSEARMRAVVDAALDAIVGADQEGNVVEFNAAAERTFGYARKEVIGKQLVELIVPPALRARHLAGFKRYLETGQSSILGQRVQTEALHADGTPFPVELALLATRIGTSETFFTAHIKDLRERRDVERALRKSQTLVRRLANSGIIGVIVADTLGNILEANDAFLEIVGFSREELQSGKVRWDEMTPPEWRKLDELAVQELKTRGHTAPWEKEYIRKDGSRVPVLVGVANLEPPDAVGFVLDLTDRKRAEESRARAENALRKVEERLRQAQKMEAIGRLAGGVAHDFNNLLSVIVGHGEFLSDQLGSPDPRHEEVKEILNAASRAAALTRQLLAFGRQQVLAPQVIDLNKTIASVELMVRRLMGEDLDVTFRLDARGHVLVDRGQLEQVLMNLIVNARDAMPTGGRLTIGTADQDLDDDFANEHLDIAPGPYVVLSVIDTGIGMDQNVQAQIFEPFFTTKEQGRGTGLGLATVFGIVKQSGGTIAVYSELGKGTTFRIYLPRADDAAVESIPPVASPKPAGGTETILLVEDDAHVRALMRTILGRDGYRVLDAATSADALAASARCEGPIHLLLTDVILPGGSGRELSERLTLQRPETRVIFMSGYTEDAIERHGALPQHATFIQKPLMPRPLLAKIREVLDASS